MCEATDLFGRLRGLLLLVVIVILVSGRILAMCGRCIQHGQHGLRLLLRWRHCAGSRRWHKVLLLLHSNLRRRRWRRCCCNLRPVDHARLLWHANNLLLLLLLWRQLLLLLRWRQIDARAWQRHAVQRTSCPIIVVGRRRLRLSRPRQLPLTQKLPLAIVRLELLLLLLQLEAAFVTEDATAELFICQGSEWLSARLIELITSRHREAHNNNYNRQHTHTHTHS